MRRHQRQASLSSASFWTCRTLRRYEGGSETRSVRFLELLNLLSTHSRSRRMAGELYSNVEMTTAFGEDPLAFLTCSSREQTTHAQLEKTEFAAALSLLQLFAYGSLSDYTTMGATLLCVISVWRVFTFLRTAICVASFSQAQRSRLELGRKRGGDKAPRLNVAKLARWPAPAPLLGRAEAAAERGADAQTQAAHLSVARRGQQGVQCGHRVPTLSRRFPSWLLSPRLLFPVGYAGTPLAGRCVALSTRAPTSAPSSYPGHRAGAPVRSAHGAARVPVRPGAGGLHHNGLHERGARGHERTSPKRDGCPTLLFPVQQRLLPALAWYGGSS